MRDEKIHHSSFIIHHWCSAKSGFQRVKRQFLPIRPVLAGAKVRRSFEDAKGFAYFCIPFLLSRVRNGFAVSPNGEADLKRKRQKFQFVVQITNQLSPYEYRDTHGQNIESDAGSMQVAAGFFATLVSFGPEFSGKIQFFKFGTPRLLQRIEIWVKFLSDPSNA